MATAALKRKPQKREIELDFIRGIAILMVMDYHGLCFGLLAPFGWLGFNNFGWAGVDVFFVLSGFLVGGLLVKEWTLKGRIDSKQFLIRRGFKIWPQYYAFILLNLISGHRTLHQLWGNLLNIQNYVGGIAHTWTLAVEEHAYLLIVALLGIAAWRKARMRHIFLLVAALAFSSIAWSFFLALRGFNISTRTDTRIAGILFGLLLAILYHHTPQLFERLQNKRLLWLSVIVGVLLELRFVSPTASWVFPFGIASADVMAVAVLLLLYRHREGHTRPALYRLVAWIGLYSYGIYLWHGSFITTIASLTRHIPSRFAPEIMSVIQALSAIAVGVLATKVIEFPALRLRERLFPRRVDSAVGVPAELEVETGTAAI